MAENRETTVIDIVAQVTDRTGPGVAGAERNVGRLESAMRKVQAEMDRMGKMGGIDLAVNLTDHASKGLGAVFDKGMGLAGKAWSVTVGLVDKVTAPFRGILDLLKNPVVAMAGMAGISFGVADAINAYKGFESEMANLKAITGMDDGEMAQISKGIREIAAASSKSVDEIAHNAKMLAEAGGDMDLFMSQLGHGVNLATATQTDMATALDFLGSTMKTFRLGDEDTQAAADSLAFFTRLANVELGQLADTYKYVAGEAANAGLGIDDLNSMLITMSEAGLKGSVAGTTLNRMLTNLSTPTDKAYGALMRLGVALYDAEGNARDMFDIMGDLERVLSGESFVSHYAEPDGDGLAVWRKGAVEKMTDELRNQFVSDIFDTAAIKGWSAFMSDGMDYIRERSREMSESAAGDFGGMGTAAGMAAVQLDTLEGSFSLLKGAADEFKLSIGEKAAPYIRRFADWLTDKIPRAAEAALDAFAWAERKARGLAKTIREFAGTDEWADADFFGKASIAWDKLIAEPFGEWWESSGKAKMSSIAEGIGSGIGSAIKWAVSGIFGDGGLLDGAQGAIGDAMGIGASFARGLSQTLDGIDWDNVWEKAAKALGDAADWALKAVFSNPVTGALAASFFGSKLLGGIGGALKGVNGLVGMAKNLFGGGKGGVGNGAGIPAFSADNMTVPANVVNVYGKIVNDKAGGGPASGKAMQDALSRTPGLLGGAAAAGGGRLLGAGARQLLSQGAQPGAQMLLPAASGAPGGDIVFTQLPNGAVLLGSGGALMEGLAGVGTTLGSGAATLGGAAAVGGGAVLGAIGGAIGVGKGIYDIVQGIQIEDEKARKDKIAQGGAEIGMVGAGAGIGAGIGALFGGVGAGPGALIGAGIGGVASLFAGGPIGRAISDWTDEGGWMNNVGKAVGGFFGETVPDFFTESVPKAASAVGGAIGKFFTETVPNFFGGLWDGIAKFFGESVPGAIGKAGNAIKGFFSKTVPKFFGDLFGKIGDFFAKEVPYAVGYAAGKIADFFTKTVPDFFGGLWDDISGFFAQTMPEALGIIGSALGAFFTETVPDFFGGLWDGISGFFAETIPDALGFIGGALAAFFTETIPGFFAFVWEGVSGFFTETIPAALSAVGAALAIFFTESIPEFFCGIWDGIAKFFAETIPQALSSIGTALCAFFTETVPDFFSSVWDGVSNFFSKTIPDALVAIGGALGTFFTETVPNFFGGLWDGISGFFTETIPDALSIIGSALKTFFAEIIPNFFGGLWDGIAKFFTQAIPEALAKIGSGIAKLVTETIPGFFGGIWDAVSGFFGGAWDAVSGFFGDVGDFFSQGFSDATGGNGYNSPTVGHSEGGILYSPHMAWVAEDGPEAIIPLSGGRRRRGLELWERAGEMLGAGPSGRPPARIPEGGGAGGGVSVSLGNVTFEAKIDAGASASPEGIARAIKENARSLADEIAGEIALSLQRAYANMPARGAF